MSYEHHGDRVRVILGDLSMGEEFGPGGEFKVDIGIGEDLGEHTEYGPGYPKDWKDKRDRLSHTLTVCFWRWGLYLSVAGRYAARAT